MTKTFYMVARIDRGIDPKSGEVAFTPGDPKGRFARASDDIVAVASPRTGGMFSATDCVDVSPTVAHHSKKTALSEAQRLAEKHPEAAGFAVLKAVAFIRRPRPPLITESLK